MLLVAIPAAYCTARVKYRGRKVFLLLALVLVTQMSQPTSLLVGLYREFYQLGMLNSVWTMVLCNAAFHRQLHRALELPVRRVGDRDRARRGALRLHRTPGGVRADRRLGEVTGRPRRIPLPRS
ncbi:hypothetical protein ACW69C_08170 [Streptomyces sp. MN3]